MNKINIIEIIKRHMDTFKDANGSMLAQDAFIFICLPLVIGGFLAFFQIKFDEQVYGLAITVFAIFAALLLSVQVALFSIHVRPWGDPKDLKEKIIQKDTIKLRKELLGELNCNISYLVIASCFFVTLTLFFSVVKINSIAETAILTGLYFHFLMNLLMTIKRAFVLFQKEYETN